MKSKISFIFSLIFTSLIFPQEDIRILSSSKNSLMLEFSPIYSISSELINNESFTKISFSSGSVINTDEIGAPSLPARQIPIGVPSEFGNTIEIVSVSSKEMEGKPLPIPTLVKDGEITAFKYEVTDRYFTVNSDESLINFGEFAIIRGMPVQYFIIKPITFSPAENKIRLYTKIIFRINFSQNQNYNAASTDNFLSGIIPNFNVAKDWIKDSKPILRKVTASNSVMASGKWIRFETNDEGIYKIDRSTLSSFGIDPSGVDPRTIKIYNNGGKALSETVNSPKQNDLVEHAIFISGEADGSFDNGDYILFYGRGINFWDYDTVAHVIKRYFHPYSTANYYWITFGGANGKRIQDQSSLNSTVKYVQPSTQAFANWEEDKINIGKTGRIYLGDDFSQSTNSRTYLNKLDGRIESTPINYFFRIVNASSGSIVFSADENNTQLFSQSFVGYGSSDYSSGVAHTRSAVYNGSLSDSRSTLRLRYTPTASTSLGYLDYFEIKYEKELKASDDVLTFYSKDTTSIIEYNLSGFSTTNIRVFNVSDPANIRSIVNPIMQSGSEFHFQAEETAGNVSKYLAVGNDKFKTPSNPVEFNNQNLHGNLNGGKLIIIYHKDLKDQALRLKSHRENNSKLIVSTVAVDVNEVYNEFSGGLLDPVAIRDFIKFAYENWTIKPEYVLLFGDGTYDFKNLEKVGDNLIPTFETLESLNVYPSSYPYDDFFARIDGNDAGVDIALGRLNISSQSEAKIVVDKIIDYETVHEKGSWRNLITLVADDHLTTSGNDGAIHTSQSETLANLRIPESFDINKIYLAAYPTVLTAIGRAKPGVYDEIINSVNRGTLILNYIGHGSPDLWAHERVFVKSSTVPLMKNEKYFFLSAATCDFGYYDIPGFQSSAEVVVNKEASGAIGAFTSSRPVLSIENSVLTQNFYSALLRSARDTLNLPIAVGKAYMSAKIIGSGNLVNDEKFLLFGDPSLRLNNPQYPAVIDSINGRDLTTDVQIKALSNTQIEGTVKKSATSNWDDYNGEGILTVYDSKRQVKIDALSFPGSPYFMTVQGGIIFRGRVSINNGRFSSGFVVPKDISYENTAGKVSIYFSNNQVDGLGYTSKVIIGGTDSSTANDGNGPDMEIYFDNSTQENTALINPNSVITVKLSDETGINTTGTGVGHKLEGILNDRTDEPIDFTNFFTGDLDAGGKSGLIRYQFNDLEPGNYQMLVKAWDVFNNPTSEIVYFTVVPGDDLFISDVYNYPNPFSNATTFTFQKNSVNSSIDVDIKIYSVAGRLIRTLEAKGLPDNFVKVDWDGRDQDGNQIANGAYIYKIIVKSTDGAFNKSVLGKLAILR